MSFLNKIAAIKPRDLEHIFNSEGMDGIIRLQKKGKINKQVFEQFVNKIKGNNTVVANANQSINSKPLLNIITPTAPPKPFLNLNPKSQKDRPVAAIRRSSLPAKTLPGFGTIPGIHTKPKKVSRKKKTSIKFKPAQEQFASVEPVIGSNANSNPKPTVGSNANSNPKPVIGSNANSNPKPKKNSNSSTRSTTDVSKPMPVNGPSNVSAGKKSYLPHAIIGGAGLTGLGAYMYYKNKDKE